jgi:DNA polymerase-3 subunit beta
MKIKILQASLLQALKTVGVVSTSKGSVPMLAHVLMKTTKDGVALTCTNLDMTICDHIDANVLEEGATTLPLKLLADAMSKLSNGVVEIESGKDGKSVISAGASIFKIMGLDADSFPKLPAGKPDVRYTLPRATFREMLRKTGYAASRDDSRKSLNGVLVEIKDGTMRTVATDGRRLSLCEYDLPDNAVERQMILPNQTVDILLRNLGSNSEGDLEIKVVGSQASFSFGTTVIYSKLFDEVYPNYRDVIPKGEGTEIGVDRVMLIEAIERVAVFASSETPSENLTFAENRLVVDSGLEGYDGARDTLPIKYSGEKITIRMNPKYLTDPLRALDDDEVKFVMLKDAAPVEIKASIPFLAVVMPISR